MVWFSQETPEGLLKCPRRALESPDILEMDEKKVHNSKIAGESHWFTSTKSILRLSEIEIVYLELKLFHFFPAINRLNFHQGNAILIRKDPKGVIEILDDIIDVLFNFNVQYKERRGSQKFQLLVKPSTKTEIVLSVEAKPRKGNYEPIQSRNVILKLSHIEDHQVLTYQTIGSSTIYIHIPMCTSQ